MLMNEACKYYDDLLATEYLESTKEILAHHSNRNELTSQGRLVCNILRPYFMDCQVYDHFKHATSLVKRAIDKLYQRLLVDENLRREIGLTEQEEGMLLFQHETAIEMRARLDGFFDIDGNI